MLNLDSSNNQLSVPAQNSQNRFHRRNRSDAGLVGLGGLNKDSSIQRVSNAALIDSNVILENSEANLSEKQKRKVKMGPPASEFVLPKLSNARRILQLESEEYSTNPAVASENPFKVAQGTERILAMGERRREIEKLNTKKFQLIQKRASGEEYIDNLYKKTIGNKEDREGIITDVKQIKAVPFLPPSIIKNIADTSAIPSHSTRLSPINSSSNDRSRKNRFLSPLSQRTRSVAPTPTNASGQGGGGGALAGLLEGITSEQQSSSPSGPLTERRHTTYGDSSGDFSELKVKPRRYQTPQRLDGQE